jgi:hypothetical protein
MQMSETPEGLFDRIPGPSPWYLRKNAPAVKGFRWQPAEPNHPAAGGKTLLVGPDGPVAALSFYNYVMALDESTLLVWNQGLGLTEVAPSEPVRLFVIEPNRLRPLDSDLNVLFERMKTQKELVALGGNTSAEMSLSTRVVDEELKAEFPEPLQSVEELLILCHSSGIATERGSVDLALLVAHPRRSEYRLYPQDWFNTAGLDYGYQWVTRVARNPQTGQIHGEGIRIEPFILDDSLRGLRRFESAE